MMDVLLVLPEQGGLWVNHKWWAFSLNREKDYNPFHVLQISSICTSTAEIPGRLGSSIEFKVKGAVILLPPKSKEIKIT